MVALFDSTVCVEMTREQAEACYVALLETPYVPHEPRHAAECFLIVQLADALGHDAAVPRWMRRAAATVA